MGGRRHDRMEKKEEEEKRKRRGPGPQEKLKVLEGFGLLVGAGTATRNSNDVRCV